MNYRKNIKYDQSYDINRNENGIISVHMNREQAKSYQI